MTWIRNNVSATITALITVVGVLITLGAVWARSQDTAEAVRDHEPRIRALEQIAPMIEDTRADVRDIRSYLIKDRR